MAEFSRPLVLHVARGGSGSATQIAAELARGSIDSPFEHVLVLRRTRSTDPERIAKLRAEGLVVELVPGWNPVATLWALVRLCRRLRLVTVVAHGLPDHLLGRWAALWAGVPHRLQVEYSPAERYSAWRRWQLRHLAPRTDAIVGVSEGVVHTLLRLGMPSTKVEAIPNGVDLSKFDAVDAHPMAARAPGLVMSARFARQKDHLTLIRALA